MARLIASMLIISLVQVTGPVPIAAFMRQVLTSPDGGYYTTRGEGGGVFGKNGDFVTSPEISQVFGELIGIWTVAEWMAQGRTRSGVQLMEVGPGKGTLMDDMLRLYILSRLVGLFGKCKSACSAARMLRWKRLTSVTGVNANTSMYPLCGLRTSVFCLKTPFIFAHEFFDALPIHAFESVPPAPENQQTDEPRKIMTPTGPAELHNPPKVANTPQWRELMVTLNPKAVEENIVGEPEFQLTKAKASTPSSLMIPEISQRYRALKSQAGSTIEISPESRIYAADFARRIGGGASSAAALKKNPASNTIAPSTKKTPSGAALIMDYGTLSTVPINSLRGIKSHEKVAPLSEPGRVDVSADVDFTALAEAAIEGSDGVEVHGPVEQGDFLGAMGIEERMRQLLRKVPDEEHRKTLETGWKRLVEKHAGSMGQIYKVMAILPENGGKRRPVGFGGGISM
ncbi:unnamed protein product [Penicillium salamii]|uniref:Protein arginine methyltransferase NDUFAF7 n=1 Tax=Penicillium salamii TaxID=1612424 RepID=A0A9W4JVZ1_9EURO|nr:unnamed protein product [Penicillium salamii]CAG8310907.1 unnamed protein product [Penicillium salamii]CAG8319559.1 unnamed protein product [Penicillium salamii]CAG8357885.1 unnamed protein product [Penicillium salamii]CAG8415893.1 unnamed protein product [Penicillium salamii]